MHWLGPQEEFPVCSCAPPPADCLGCLDDCVNRAVRVCYVYTQYTMGGDDDDADLSEGVGWGGRRQVLVECVASHCPCGDQCANQRIQRGVMPAVSIEDCGPKGLGLFVRQDVRACDFVGEYMGEIVTETEYHMRRLVRGIAAPCNDANTSMMTCV